MDWRVTELFLK